MKSYIKRPLFLATVLASLFPLQSSAENLSLSTCGQAVSCTNGWISGSLGGFEHSHRSGVLALAEVGVTVPVGDMFGLQLDGFDGAAARHNFAGIEVYGFWRSPRSGLLGIHVKHQQFGGINETLYGFRGDAYIENWTFAVEAGGVRTNLSGIQGTFYGDILANWYMNPNLKFDAGYFRIKEDNMVRVGGEYQFGWPNWPGLTAFAELGAGDHDLHYGFIGLNYYFGGNKSLIQRHREDTVTPMFEPVTFKHLHIATKAMF